MNARLIGAAVLVVLLWGCGSLSVSQAMDDAVGKLTFEEAVTQWGPPSYERVDRASRLRMVQWVSESTSITPAPPPPRNAGGFAGGMAQGLAAGRPTEVDVTRRILTIWFDERGVMRRWARSSSVR